MNVHRNIVINCNDNIDIITSTLISLEQISMGGIPKLTWFSSRLAAVSAQSIETRGYEEDEDVVGAAPKLLQLHLSDQLLYCLQRCDLY